MRITGAVALPSRSQDGQFEKEIQEKSMMMALAAPLRTARIGISPFENSGYNRALKWWLLFILAKLIPTLGDQHLWGTAS
jgi:hypothetical protein